MSHHGNSLRFSADIRLRIILIASVLTVLSLSVLRIAHTVSFSEASQLMTSGDEVASIFAIWKFQQGLDIYTSRFEPPYALAVYNWLFYVSNAYWTQLLMSIFSLSDAWIPTLARLWTAVGAACGSVGAFLLFRKLLQEHGLNERLLPASLAAFLGFGPLYGFWVVTVRPDVWAISLEIIAVVIFLSLYPRQRLAALITTALVAYLAWSFKHTTIFGLGGICLFLLVRRDFWGFSLLVALSILFWGATLLANDYIYTETLFALGHPLAYGTDRLVRNAANVAIKTTYLWVPLLCIGTALVALKRSHIHLPKDNATLLAITGLVVTLPTTLLMMLQTGSSENYAFTLAFFMTLLLVCLLPRLPRLDAFACKVGNGSLAVGFILTALAVSIVLTGHKGVIRPQGDQDLIDRRIACLKKLPVPLYVNNRVLSLPWNTPGTPYVRSFYYERDRENGKEYANGGIGGMINSGAFEAIAYLEVNESGELDGSDLSLYRQLPIECGKMTIYIRATRKDIGDITARLRTVR